MESSSSPMFTKHLVCSIKETSRCMLMMGHLTLKMVIMILKNKISHIKPILKLIVK